MGREAIRGGGARPLRTSAGPGCYRSGPGCYRSGRVSRAARRRGHRRAHTSPYPAEPPVHSQSRPRRHGAPPRDCPRRRRRALGTRLRSRRHGRRTRRSHPPGFKFGDGSHYGQHRPAGGTRWEVRRVAKQHPGIAEVWHALAPNENGPDKPNHFAFKDGSRVTYRGDSTITIWRFSIRGICSTFDVVSISARIRSNTRTPIS